MATRIDLTGKKYGKLLVTGFSHLNNTKHAYWHVICDCGTVKTVRSQHLKGGMVKACGCLRGERHGRSGDPLYNVWRGMLSRCNNPNNGAYIYYGSRGIAVCKRWLRFGNFQKDMGERPEGLTIERIDNNGDYKLSNCKWATTKEQMNNNRHNVVLTYKGVSMTMQQWAEKLGIHRACLWARVNKKLPTYLIFNSKKISSKGKKYKTKYTKRFGFNLEELSEKLNLSTCKLSRSSDVEIDGLLETVVS